MVQRGMAGKASAIRGPDVADLFDAWRKAKYGDIEFPYTDLEIKGSLRTHTHEYLKRPGGEVETLGRRCYTFGFKCRFVDVFERYADLYPSRLSAIISQCESEQTYDLWVPPMERSFRVKATDWARTITANLRNGEDVSLTFVEDSTEQYTTLNLIGTRRAALMPDATVVAQQVAALEDPVATDRLDALIETLDGYLTQVALAEAEADYQTARIDAVIQRCEALANVPIMQTPPAAPALTALLGVWAFAAQEKAASVALARPILLYEVKRPTMSVLDVAVELYGTPGKSAELLRLNDLDNALAIRRGTFLRYLPAL